MSLGRLGTWEFDLLSDADVLFVCDHNMDKEESQRAAERLMEALTAYTRDGTVFPVDTRLRPHGREGELIVTPAQLEAYLREEAKPWEALTYLKLRYTAGDLAVAQRALEAARNGIAEVAKGTEFGRELSEMRERLERSESMQNLKTAPGGSYDIDYLSGFLQARNQLWFVGNLPARLQMLTNHGCLSDDECHELVESAHFLRTIEHLVRLVSGRARKWLPVAEHPRRAVQKLLWQIMGGGDSFDPEMQLTKVLRQTRSVYRKYLRA
jgi:glutamate-ammonia-ligase adenylyltransferase